MKIGIIGAMEIEVEHLKAEMTTERTVERAGMKFFEGKIGSTDVVVVQCGVGKVNAAACVQILCDCFEVTHVINTGVAGSMDADIDLYSTGSGENEKLYLGVQPLHYLISKNGDIYTYQASSYQNKMTGKRDSATIKYIKTLSQSNLQKIENELKSIAESNSSNSISWNSTSWYVKIDGKSKRVNVNVQTQVLNKYL